MKSNENKSKAQIVSDKILAKIIKDVKFIFKENGGISPRDEKIIKENFMIKQPSWSSLGDGVKNILSIVTPIAINTYQNELIEAMDEE
tara:strand:+ start:4849 stop:5112 length:264 start_codon:yes stop_codon:yes gene_type:complete